MVVLIIFISFAGTLLILQQVKGLRRPKALFEENQQLKTQLSMLEERVRTLERIATDKKSNLKETIDSLYLNP